MRFPRYWAKGGLEVADAKGRNHRFDCWGWSDDSVDEARRVGQERAAALGRRIIDGKRPGRYSYGDRPVREEVLEEISGDGQGLATVITRNAYGCEVLNSSEVMFIDVDEPRQSMVDRLKRGLVQLFAGSKRDPTEEWRATVVEGVRFLCGSDSRIGARIYSTRGGLRILMTHATADPTSESTRAMMGSLGADPMYVRLCRLQQSFRARLTPKPWRCGIRAPAIRFPFPDETAESAFRVWERSYRAASEPYATCRYLLSVGSREIHPRVAEVVELHDRMTRVDSKAPLA